MTTGHTSAAVATTEKRTLATQVNDLMTSEQARAYIEPFLPPGTDIRRVAASLLVAIKRDETGKLRQCTPESLLLGVAKIQQWSLELGTSAYLIPFGKEATPVRSYQAIAKLAAACGYPIETKVVRDGDHFEYEFGLNQRLEHRPVAKSRAPITHVWAIVQPPRHARPIVEVMTADEVEEIRQKYSKQWKVGELPGWYCKKTLIRRVAKTLPDDPKLKPLHDLLESEADDLQVAEQEIERAQLTPGQGEAEGFQDDRDLDDEFRDRMGRED